MNDIESRLVFRTEYADGSGMLSTGTRYGSGLTPDEFAVQLIERTRIQRPHLTEEFLVTVWEEDADADDYPLRNTPAP
ncbi:hypothetical protein JGS39_24160, partial [Streptomyces sp. P01-B04]|uniref:hypothetical protein n=2 Tax=Streptomyces poriferorum TaxID=2798799 RepID=UPI001C5DB497